METLAIMDYSIASINLYDIDEDADIDEDYIRELGYNPDECSWMFNESIQIYNNEERLL